MAQLEPFVSLLSILPFPEIDPVLISVGPLQIHWYGLAYVAGIVLGWLYAKAIVRNSALWPRGEAAMSEQDLDDFLLWVAIGIVGGGRIGYILFYDLASVIANPLRAIEIWNGGMSFHGGLIGTILAMTLFARRRSIRLWSLFDVVAAVVPIGLFFGRIANFINGELWGRLSSAPWAIVFPTAGPSPAIRARSTRRCSKGSSSFRCWRFSSIAAGRSPGRGSSPASSSPATALPASRSSSSASPMRSSAISSAAG